jgi:hypothetical protein
MKKTVISAFAFALSLASFGQDSTKTKEIHLSIADFSPTNVHLKFKKQMGEKSFYKLGLVNMSLQKYSPKTADTVSVPISSFRYSGGLEFGVEFRKQLAEKLCFFHGPNLSFNYNKGVYSSTPDQGESTYQSYRLSIPYTLGFLYNLNSNILLGAEVNPSLSYSHHKQENPNKNITANGIDFGFNNSLLMSLVYRF